MKFRIALATAVLGVLAFAGRADATGFGLDVSFRPEVTCTGYSLELKSQPGAVEADVFLWGDATGAKDPTQVKVGHIAPNTALVYEFHRPAGTYSGGVSLHYVGREPSNRSFTVIVPSCDGSTTVATTPTLPPTAPATTSTTVVCTGTAGGPPLATCPTTTTATGGLVIDTLPSFPTTTTTAAAKVAGIRENATTTTTVEIGSAVTLPRTGAIGAEFTVPAAIALVGLGIVCCLVGVFRPRRDA